jgi:hypothetical protein
VVETADEGQLSIELVFLHNFDVCGAKGLVHYSMESVALRRGRRFTVHFELLTAAAYC